MRKIVIIGAGAVLALGATFAVVHPRVSLASTTAAAPSDLKSDLQAGESGQHATANDTDQAQEFDEGQQGPSDNSQVDSNQEVGPNDQQGVGDSAQSSADAGNSSDQPEASDGPGQADPNQ